jgi:hypothetical protein
VRLDRKATSISLNVVLGVRADGQKVLLAIKSMAARAPNAGNPLGEAVVWYVSLRGNIEIRCFVPADAS